MSHKHEHEHDLSHHHDESTPELDAETLAALDPDVSDSDLPPSLLSRRNLFRAAGLVGGGAAATALGVTPAMAEGRQVPTSRATPTLHRWLAGDHHIHTQFSSDAMYRVADQVQHGQAYGMDWLVITDHGSVAHAKIGVHKVNPDIRAARDVSRARWCSRDWSGTSRPPSTAPSSCTPATTRSRCCASSRTASTER